MASCRLARAAALFAVAAFLTASSFGQTAALKIDEPQIKFRLSAHPAVEIPVVNTSGKALPGDFKLELLATDDRVEQVVTGSFQGSPGTSVEKIAWPQDSKGHTPPARLGWRRLRYSFTPRPEFGVGAAQGIVQMSHVLAGIFQVRLAGASRAKPGSRYPVRVRVDDPLTGRPRRGAAVELTLTLDDDNDTTFKHALLTGYDGYAVYTFDLPKETKAEQGTVTAEVTRGGFGEQAEMDFDLRVANKVTLTTDKPLYQPGQTAHLRVLALGPDRRALANREVAIAIEDEDRNEQFVETVKTSRFGVASADWDIPLKLRLGDYLAAAKVKSAEDEDDYDSQPASATLRVSRYELPTFTVKAEPDRKYYLPGQDAKIAITADYLFGKPVQNATVRLVRQQERHWDFKEQKWETDESDPIEGSFDKQGRFEAKVDLGDEFAGFDPEDQSHYEDLTFAAYVTDLSTKRTEQRRFRVRLSQQPVQIYVIGGEQWSPANEPATLYVTSSYADGQPASVNGTLYFAEPNEKGEFEKIPWQGGRSKALGFHTNRFGVGKIALPRIRERFLGKPR
ncbi:MAG TPA: MG2 domain-containing protein, partial [Bryobacteraceae bacterium]|nr:MG2 domain-containing protein [Bryobacteraceae bacterium]